MISLNIVMKRKPLFALSLILLLFFTLAISTSIVIAMMFATAGYVSYESFARLLAPQALEVSPLTILAAITSGILCYGLSVYQHYVGKGTVVSLF